ncbi:MAG: hypothetical protein ACP5K9_01820 [Candidatus Micrarchaeia archaeon]
MKVLMVDTGVYLPGGENYYESFNYYKVLARAGFDVSLYKNLYYDKPKEISVQTREAVLKKIYNMIITFSPMDFPFINEYIKRTRVNPIIIFVDKFEFIKDLAAKVSIFDFPFQRIKRNFTKLVGNIDMYVVFSHEDELLAKKLFGENEAIKRMLPFIDHAYFVRSNEQLKDDPKKPILFFSRLSSRQTNLDLIVKAVDYIVKDTDFLETNDLLIEITASGGDKESFQEVLRKKKLLEYFRFIPILPRELYISYLREHRFSFMAPMKHLDLKQIIISLASGVPVLIDDEFNEKIDPFSGARLDRFFTSDINAIVKDNVNGMIYKRLDYKDLAEKMMQMASMDLSSMKNKALESVEKFDIESGGANFLKMIKEVINKESKYGSEQLLDREL